MTDTLPPSEQAITVSQLNRLTREILEQALPLCWVVGEISNLTYAQSGHVYFTLKDANAQVRCVMWRNKAQLLGARLGNGQKIEARVLPSFYEIRGDFQLTVEAVRRAGQGELFERFLQLKEKLEREGLFSNDTKRLLPPYPQHVVIVTSPRGAALHDVLQTLQRRSPQLRVTISPCLVQGATCSPQIAHAIQKADQIGADIIILCRGGGSLEDLWGFNEEVVAKAIRSSRTPIITGIGHETDFTIADFTADLRAPTPTAAAELCSPSRESLLSLLTQTKKQLKRQLSSLINSKNQTLDGWTAKLTPPSMRIKHQQLYLQKTKNQLCHQLSVFFGKKQKDLALKQTVLRAKKPEIAPKKRILLQTGTHLKKSMERQLEAKKMQLNGLTNSLNQLCPYAILNRGYAIPLNKDGKVVYDSSTLAQNETITLRMAKANVFTTVNQVEQINGDE